MYSMVLMAALTTTADLPDWGRRRGWGCCGCYGGYGWGGWGRGWGGGYGGWGGYAGWGGYGGGWGGWGGGYGGWGGYGVWSGVGGFVSAQPVASYGSSVLAANISPPTATTKRPAKLIVHLPADAKLKVDGKAMRTTSDTRRFMSPPLEVGQGYYYDFQAQVQRDGKPVTVNKRVIVRAGQTQEITLRFNDQTQQTQAVKLTRRSNDKTAR